jgi:hypothetical protein
MKGDRHCGIWKIMGLKSLEDVYMLTGALVTIVFLVHMFEMFWDLFCQYTNKVYGSAGMFRTFEIIHISDCTVKT